MHVSIHQQSIHVISCMSTCVFGHLRHWTHSELQLTIGQPRPRPPNPAVNHPRQQTPSIFKVKITLLKPFNQFTTRQPRVSPSSSTSSWASYLSGSWSSSSSWQNLKNPSSNQMNCCYWFQVHPYTSMHLAARPCTSHMPSTCSATYTSPPSSHIPSSLHHLACFQLDHTQRRTTFRHT